MAEVRLGVDVVDRRGHVEPGHACTLEPGPDPPTRGLLAERGPSHRLQANA
jgi:hypothetical protein